MRSTLGRLARAGVATITIACGALVAAGAAPVHAAPSGTCGADWQLKSIQGVVDFIYDANPLVQQYRGGTWKADTYQALADFDNASAKGHGDGYLCVKTTGSSPGSDKQYCGRLGYDICFAYVVTNINDNNSSGKATA